MKLSTHIPVLVNEIIAGLNLKPGDNAVDATLGGGGHALAMLEATAPEGKLLGIDLDKAAIERAQERLNKNKKRIILKQGNYADISNLLYESRINSISAILLDLGLSRDQLEDKSRGFSFQTQGSLDMRFSDQGELTAGQIVNTWSENDLAHIFRQYGEERHAARAAKHIIAARKRAPITSTTELVALVMRGVGSRGGTKRVSARGRSAFGRHPATRIFQALRIATNGELDNLSRALPHMVAALEHGGRLAVISYHSLEDRIVKNFFRQEARGCLCPVAFPECRCEHEPTVRLINRRIIVPSEEEVHQNHSARSAKLRIAEKL